MKCLETRRGKAGMTRRRYDTPAGPVTTYEVPASVIRAVGMTRIVHFMGCFERGQAQRKRAAELRAAIASQPRATATGLAAELGCTEARVRQIRAELRKAST